MSNDERRQSKCLQSTSQIEERPAGGLEKVVCLSMCVQEEISLRAEGVKSYPASFFLHTFCLGFT